MENNKLYILPSLAYNSKDLEPYISEQQLTIHHQKHHQNYVNGANAILEKLEKARKEGIDLDMKATLKEFSFNLGGHELHSTFWQNLAPRGRGGGGEPKGILKEEIEKEYFSFERFKKEFSQAALSVEGSGWAVLTYCKETKRLAIMQVEKHNVNFPVGYPLLMALDLWEHAYYLDYKNERGKFIEAFWNIVNWEKVGEWFEKVK